jgi:hypothetical protein
MKELFHKLSEHIEYLQKREKLIDPRSYKIMHGPLQLAIHHLTMCKNILGEHLTNDRGQGKRGLTGKTKRPPASR